MSAVSSLRGASGLLSTVFLLTLPALAQAPADYEPVATEPYMEGDAEIPPEEGAVYARLRHFEGGISLRREDAEAARDLQLAVNTPIIPGDQIWTGEDGRAEIQLADGSVLRLDRNSRLSILNLADREGSFDNTILVRLLNGSLYARAENFDPRTRRFQVDTPGGSVFLLSSGVYRVDVAPNGVSTVASYRGVAELLAEDVSMIAHSGERVTAEPGEPPGEARAFNTLRRDAFDVWAERRDDATAGADSARGPRPDVPEPVRPYLSELDRYGNWRNDPEYGWIWIPDDLEPDWRPYYSGHWAYGPVGPMWVAYEPWGWAPYHYGRWHWGAGFGWFWSPGWIFSGAYVSWSIGPTYFGWCPLGFYGYPVYVGYYPWVYVQHGHFYSHHVHRHSVGWADVARGRFGSDGVILRGHPRVRPGYGLEQGAKATYRRALSNPTYVKDLPAKGSWARRAAFRDAEQADYRRLTARRATPEAKGVVPRAAGRARSVDAPRRPSGATPSIPPRQPALSPGAPGGSRVQPTSARTPDKPGRVSPATGRPMQPPVRLTPPRHQPDPSDSDQIKGSGRRPDLAPPPPDAKPPVRRTRVRTPSGRVIELPPSDDASRVRAHPHPRVEPGRNGTGKVPFVMPRRPSSGSKAPAMGGRGGPKAPTPRPAPAKPAAPAKKGGDKKGGKN